MFDKINLAFYKKIISKYNISIVSDLDWYGRRKIKYTFNYNRAEIESLNDDIYNSICIETTDEEESYMGYVEITKTVDLIDKGNNQNKDIYRIFAKFKITKTSIDYSTGNNEVAINTLSRYITYDNLNDDYYMDVIFDNIIKYIDIAYELENNRNNIIYNFKKDSINVMDNIEHHIRDKKLKEIEEVNNECVT